MTLITPDDVLVRIAPAAYDRLLVQRVIDEEEAELIARYGAHYAAGQTVTETLPGAGRTNLYLRRRAASMTSVRELVLDAEELLTSSEYRLWGQQARIERLPAGATWGDLVTVAYTPANDNAQRRSVLAELCRLALERTAHRSERSDDYSYTAPDDWEAERRRLLNRLAVSRW